MGLLQVIHLTPGTTSWIVPGGAVVQRIQCWGPGGSGGVLFSASGSQRLASGAGSGGYGELNLVGSLSGFTSGNTYQCNIGSGGAAVVSSANGNPGSADTWFGAASYAAATVGGQAGTGGFQGVAVASISNGVGGAAKGDLAFSGGNGGVISGASGGAIFASGGGGSPGPDGAGSNGGALTGSSVTCSAGGNADNGTITGGTAGTFGGANGANGGSTTDKGGAGGGGSINNPTTGGNGGDYGGGGAGAVAGNSGATSGAGGNGRITITILLPDITNQVQRRYTRRRA